jgi:NitT/TauT family transport system permease protein
MVHLSEFFIRQRPRPLIFRQSRQFIETAERYAYKFEQKIFGPVQKRLYKYHRKLKISKSVAIMLLVVILVIFTILKLDSIAQSLSSLFHMYLSIYQDIRAKAIVSQIPLALLLSFLRLLAAYLITLAWTIPVAIKIARNPRFEKLMPFFQTVASIPATALFPFMVILVDYVPGGLEFPSILLILTGMQWYVLFNLIGGVRSVSGDLEEVAKAFRSDRTQYLKRILFPSVYPSFITGSITGWGGGWNSLIVAEYIVFGNKTYSVLGMGSLLDRAAYELGNTVLILLIVGVMVAVIFAINRFVWRRLYKKVIEKYSMSG